MAKIKVPELAESITEGTVARWIKKPGDIVTKGEYIVELETDKVNIEISSDYDGILDNVKFQEGDTVKVGETIAIIKDEGTSPKTELKENKKEENETVEDNEEEAKGPTINNNQNDPEKSLIESKRIIASPAARKLAREKGIDLKNISPIDPLGRLRVHDLSKDPSTKELQPTQEFMNNKKQTMYNEQEKPVEKIKMTRRRQTIANKLVEVQRTAAMLTTFNEIDMTNVINLRRRRKDQFHEEYEVKLGYMSFFTKAAVASLKKMPLLNAEIREEEIILKKYYDIGIAVSANEGLVVPVVRDADRKNFAEIEKDIFDLAEKARQNKLALKDLQGGTFTITNGGIFGSLLSTPILNVPQVAILGMHSIQLRPVAVDAEKMENHPMMYVALSYDHRIVDGKEAVTFLKHIKNLIEDPESLLFEV